MEGDTATDAVSHLQARCPPLSMQHAVHQRARALRFLWDSRPSMPPPPLSLQAPLQVFTLSLLGFGRVSLVYLLGMMKVTL